MSEPASSTKNGGLLASLPPNIRMIATAVLTAAGLGVGGGYLATGPQAVIDKEALRLITLQVADIQRRDETFVGGGAVPKSDFEALQTMVERNAEQIASLIELSTDQSKTLAILVERTRDP